jgi:hypothetical protein
VIGAALSLSSTALIIPVLAERKRLNLAAGRVSFAVLLFQDLAVAPLLFMVTMLVGSRENGLELGLALTLAPAALALIGLIVLGRLVLRPLFHSVAMTRSTEFFMAACLLVVFGTGLIAAISGLSMALGAFVAGLLLAETEYRREVEVTIEPFKGLLLGLFFVAVGEHGNDEGGRGQRERRPDHQRRHRRLAEPEDDGAEQQRRQHDLGRAEPEHEPAHPGQPLERQFEAHHEQEEHDAERRDPVDRLDIGQRQRVEPGRARGESAEPERPERDARQQEAEHRADVQPEEQRRDDSRRDEKDQRLLVDGEIEGSVHPRLRLGAARIAGRRQLRRSAIRRDPFLPPGWPASCRLSRRARSRPGAARDIRRDREMEEPS